MATGTRRRRLPDLLLRRLALDALDPVAGRPGREDLSGREFQQGGRADELLRGPPALLVGEPFLFCRGKR